MIEKHHHADGTDSIAVFSDCMDYRYLLTRVWDPAGPKALFILLNPSTADEIKNDPTVERCERRARALGYGAFRVTNIFAYRATDPKVMRAHPNPVGPDNDAAIRDSVGWADFILSAWGSHGDHLARGKAVETMLRRLAPEVSHLGLTKSGNPRHPLYIGYDQAPIRWW